MIGELFGMVNWWFGVVWCVSTDPFPKDVVRRLASSALIIERPDSDI